MVAPSTGGSSTSVKILTLANRRLLHLSVSKPVFEFSAVETICSTYLPHIHLTNIYWALLYSEHCAKEPIGRKSPQGK